MKVHYKILHSASKTLCGIAGPEQSTIESKVTCIKCMKAIGIDVAPPKERRYVVTDTATGATGYLQRQGAYLLGGSYMNPSWDVQWDRDDT